MTWFDPPAELKLATIPLAGSKWTYPYARPAGNGPLVLDAKVIEKGTKTGAPPGLKQRTDAASSAPDGRHFCTWHHAGLALTAVT
jgi:hypothetical protein